MIDLITAEKTTIEIFNYYLEKLPLEEGCVCRCLKEKWMVLTPTPGISDLFDHLIRAGMLYALRHPDAIHVVEQARDPPGEEQPVSLRSSPDAPCPDWITDRTQPDWESLDVSSALKREI